MKKKVAFIILTLIFIGILISISVFLNKQNEKILVQEGQSTNTINNNFKEEEEMNVFKVTSENFEKEVLESEKTVLVDFYADWCGPCKMLSPIVEEIAKENEDIKVVKVNIDEAQDLAIKYQVMSIPTLVVIKNGEVSDRTVGLKEKSKILDMLK